MLGEAKVSFRNETHQVGRPIGAVKDGRGELVSKRDTNP
jgi:hypothetical protein